MRETVAAVVVTALLGVACEAKTNAPAPAAAQAASRTVPSAGVAAIPAAAPADDQKPERKANQAIRVAKARKPAKVTGGTEQKARGADVGEPGATAIRLSQSPPSSY